MEIKATIRYKGATADYKIERESPGIYLASLIYYGGTRKNTPAATITLIRGIRQWTGSCDAGSLLQQLGTQIDSALKNGDSQPGHITLHGEAGGRHF